MPIGITEEHEALHDAARGWAERHCPPAVARELLDAPHDSLPPFWHDLREQGWLGLHVSEELGGEGFGLPELVVVLEELGRAVAPGPFVPTVLAAAILEAAGGHDEYLMALATGTSVGAVALTGALEGEETDGGVRLSGTLGVVVSAQLADVLVVPARVDGTVCWCVLLAGEFEARELPSIDLNRRVGEVSVDVTVAPRRVLAGLHSARVRELAGLLFAAEAVGLAGWCVDTAADYAKAREQFGRPIGQFQGVKHRCAEMLAHTELARAAVWDAARSIDEEDVAPFTVAAAVSLAVDAAVEAGKSCVQVLGGIGFTWEHDAHLYLRRATAIRALVGPSSTWRLDAARLVLGGTRRKLSVDLPPEAESYRADVRAFLDEISTLGDDERVERMAEAGYVVPQWPAPWGRDASAVEQMVIEEEFRAAKVSRPRITIGMWALPALIVYGTPEQQQRWISPTLRGKFVWCQLFSEPGAGSDLASLTTGAKKVEGGYVLNGQKVWTSMAHTSDWGICLARTDQHSKHNGISCFMVDMKSEGIDIRPLRELTGEAMFNEVFFNDVFVPVDCLVGAENDGWRAARTTLANERVFMGGGSSFSFGLEGLLQLVDSQGLADDTVTLGEVGALAAEAHALGVLGYRLTLKSLAGADPSGSEAAVKKMLGVEHDQRVQEVGLGLLGAAGASREGVAATWTRGFLMNRCLTIAGGTSEIQRNVIGERMLGLPRDP
ncbi:MAG: acyl-CoA dehydrogenase [Acidimicrobiia bacterium]